MSDNGRGDNLTAFLLGGLAGVVAALLLAPRTGKETRRRVKKWLEDLEEKGEGLFEDGREMFEDGKQAVQDKADKLKRAFDAGRKSWDKE